MRFGFWLFNKNSFVFMKLLLSLPISRLKRVVVLQEKVWGYVGQKNKSMMCCFKKTQSSLQYV